MGQKLGKAKLIIEADAFVNLSKNSIQHTWQMFNDISDGFGICKEELEEICADLKVELNISRMSMLELTSSLFKVFDTDNNGLIDALEFFGTISSLSGMKLFEILDFTLRCYDFDGSGYLSVDEVTLALKSMATGLCKLELIGAPKEDRIENLVSNMFSSLNDLNNEDSSTFRIPTIVDYLLCHPDIKSWYSHYEITKIPETFETNNNLPVEIRKKIVDENTIEWDLTSMSYDHDFEESHEEPWKNSVSLLIPLQYADTEIDRKCPEVSLDISWVYGYQSKLSSNNLVYNSQGCLVYHIGRFAIVYSLIDHCQNIFTGHTHEILCLAIHPKGFYVATGDEAVKSRIIIWNSTTFEIVFTDNSTLENGISNISFSDDGSMICAMSNDFYHSVSIIKWDTSEVLFTSVVSTNPTSACSFRKDGTLVVGGTTYINFWYHTDEGYIKRDGIFSKHVASQGITCIVQSKNIDSVVTGTNLGQLFLWQDRNCIRNIKGHDGVIEAMHSSDHGILSGGTDFRIRIWSHKLEPGVSFDLSFFGILPSIRSSCLSSDGTCIALGTLGGNIYEISAIDGSDLRGGPIACSHFTGNLCCTAPHPSKHEFITVGDDKHLRIWDMKSHTLLKLASFDAEVRCVAYNPLGDMIVVGFGGDKFNSSKSGAFCILNEEDLSLIHEARDSQSPITLVSYSPEGETLAVACEEGAIFLYAVQDEYELIGRCVRHTTPVYHLDFSIDGEWIRSNSLAKEIGFFNADDASYQSNLASMRDIQWFSQSCIYSWHVKSVHRTSFKDDIVTSLHTPSPNSKFLACGTSTGYIRLHPFPCVPENSECQRFQSHVGTVSSIKFSFCGSYLISLGMSDRCIIQWTVRPHRTDVDVIQPTIDINESDDLRAESREIADLKEDFMSPSSIDPSGLFFGANQLVKNKNDSTTPSPVDSWIGSIVAPSNLPNINKSIPEVSLKLTYVYGFRSQDMRNHIKYNSSGDIVFAASTIGVVMNKSTGAQSFYKIHSDAISALACSSDGTLVATGQMGHKAIVAIWDACQLKTLRILPENQKGSVTALCFSNNTLLLAVASLDEDHTVSVYNWKHRILVSRTHAGSGRVFDFSFSENDSYLLSCGVKFIKIWDIRTRYMTCSKPCLKELGDLQTFLCCTYFNMVPIIGSIDGSLYVLVNNGEYLHKNIKAHDGELTSMVVSNDKKQLATGGKDGLIRLWNTTFDCVKEISLETVLSYRGPKVRSIHFNRENTTLLVGTRTSEIIEINIRSGTLTNARPILQGHGHRELWGLTTHPKKDEFITTGDDGTLRIWDSKNFTMLKKINIDAPSRAVTYSADGTLIAIGFGNASRSKSKLSTKDGAFTILNTADNKIIHEGKDSNEPIRVLKFSNDGKLLAVGSEDSKIYIYNVKDKFSRRAIISSHKAPVLNLDFTVDSQFLMSIDSTHRIYYSETSSGINVPSPAALRDEKWATWSAPVGWPVQGFWKNQPEGTFPSCLQKSWSGMLLACGNTSGRIFLSHNPCINEAGYVDDFSHSGNVSRVSWTSGDSYLISIGSIDHTIMQWKCLYDNARESGEEGGLSCDDSDLETIGGKEFIYKSKSSNENAIANPQWITNIAPPSDILDDDETAPQIIPLIDFLHGPRISDCRQSFGYNEDGNILFSSAACCIVYDRDKHSQNIFTENFGPIVCLDIDSTGRIGASGNCSKYTQINLWDARTAKMLQIHKNVHKNGITSLKFSSSSDLLVSLGHDEMNSVILFKSPSKRWNDSFVLATTGVSFSKMIWTLYAENNEYPIVVGGNRRIYFLRLTGKSMERIRGTFGRRRKLQPILCGVVALSTKNGHGDNSILTGTTSGHIYVWVGRSISSVISAHDSSICCISTCRKGYATGGKDGFIKIWSEELKLIYAFNVQSFDPLPLYLPCHSIKANLTNSRLLIGMQGGEVYEVSLDTNSTSFLFEGHGYGELHAIGFSPTDSDKFATAGDDGSVKIWSLKNKKCIKRTNISSAIRALAWYPDGSALIIGIGGDPKNSSKDGAFCKIDLDSLDIVYEERKAKKFIADIKFGVGSFVIFSSDGCAYIHDSQNFSLIKKIEIPSKVSAGITRADLSFDFKYIRMSTSNQEVYYYNVTGEMINSPIQIRNTQWDTHNCIYSWTIKGCWPPIVDQIAVVATDICIQKKLIAVAYENGDVLLYRYPCQNYGNKYIKLFGTATQCTKLIFSSNGNYLIILDKLTRSIIQYKLVNK